MEDKLSVIYKEMISDDLRISIKEYFESKESSLVPVKGSSLFPLRKSVREIPGELADELCKQLLITMQQYFIDFKPNKNNIRLYLSNYGVVAPHKDKPVYPGDTHTLLIYITDDFDGGILSVKLPRSNLHLEEYGDKEKKYIVITPEPRINYGVLFPKNIIHYTNELINGNKLILLIDCEIIS